MLKSQKIVFGILLILCFTLFNVWRVVKTSYEKDISSCKDLNDKRIFSLFVSNTNINRLRNTFGGINIETNEINKSLLSDPTIAILLSEFQCNKCQEKELKRLNELKNKLDDKGIKTIGITTLSKKNQVTIQKKMLKLNFSIYWVDDNTFKEISISNDFPQVIYLKENIIQTAFVPVPLDDEFSIIYYEHLLKNL